MVINLATIDFCPANGGGEAVIRPLDVTENGTYRAPSGVDGYSPVSVNVSGGGSITPEEQAALDTLVDASEGLLYTDEYEGMHSRYNKYTPGDYFDIGRIFDTGDGIYSFSNLEFCKFNTETLSFEYIRRFNNSQSNLLWKDKTGRFYDGSYYALNFDTGEEVYIDFGDIPPINQYFYKGNIFYGQYAVWCISDSNAYKFNEDTQKFVLATINVPAGVSGIFETVCGKFKYKGHWLFYNNGNIYEIKEYEDHIDIVTATGDYFNMPSFNMSWQYLFATTDGLYYFEGSNLYVYDETSGQWTTLDYLTLLNGEFWWSPYVVCNNFVIGGRNQDQKTYNVTNLGDDYTITYWQDVKNVAVDLKSYQEISGQKVFQNLSAGYMMYNGSEMMFSATDMRMRYVGKSKTSAISLGFEVPGSFTLNDVDIATVNNCIVNQTVSYPGSKFMKVCNWTTGLLTYPYAYQYFYSTPSGRVIYANDNDSFALEFNGSQFVALNTVTNFVVSSNRAVVGNDLYVSYNMKLYKWDDVAGDFVYVTDMPNQEGIWAADANTLRLGQYLYLVNNGGTYSWESDPYFAPFNSNPKSFIIGQNVYVLNYNQIFMWDESTGTSTTVQYLTDYPTDQHLVEYDGYVYYMSGSIAHRIDVTKAGTTDFDVVSDIFWGGWDCPLLEYAGILYTMKPVNNGEFGYIYNVTSEVPEVPGSDGTYTLKAVRVGGQITYSWELDV